MAKNTEQFEKEQEKVQRLEQEELALKEKLEQIKEQMKLKKREKSQAKRKLDTRKKIVIGAKFISFLDIESEEEAERILEMFGNNIKAQSNIWKRKESNNTTAPKEVTNENYSTTKGE